MDIQTDERLLINIEGYLIELVCNVENIDEFEPGCGAIGLGAGRSPALGPRAN